MPACVNSRSHIARAPGLAIKAILIKSPGGILFYVFWFVRAEITFVFLFCPWTEQQHQEVPGLAPFGAKLAKLTS